MRHSLLRHHVQKENLFKNKYVQKKYFESKEAKSCGEEINLTPQDGIANID